MTNERPDEPDSAEPEASEPSRTSFRSALRGLRRAASEVADAASVAADAGAEEARKLAEAARPEIERRAQQAKAAAEAARPRIGEKAREATNYVREHQDEIVNASKRGAEVAASGAARAVTPGPLRPALDAMERELRDPPAAEGDTADDANLEDDVMPESGDDAPTPSESDRS